jgi:hypothetical protein
MVGTLEQNIQDNGNSKQSRFSTFTAVTLVPKGKTLKEVFENNTTQTDSLADLHYYLNQYNKSLLLKGTDDTKYAIGITISPTANCQVFSVSQAWALTQFENGAHLLKQLSTYSGKSLAIIDIKDNYVADFENLFKKDKKCFLISQKYNSSNGSIMKMYLIDTRLIEI